MKKKGRVQAGADADLTIFDPAMVIDRATYLQGDIPSDGIVHVRLLGANPNAGRADLEMLRKGQLLIGFAEALSQAPTVQDLASREVTAFALELMPRITRAQSMDILSSMGTVAGYKAVLIAANALPKMFPMLMTAAGTVTPAKVLIGFPSVSFSTDLVTPICQRSFCCTSPQ